MLTLNQWRQISKVGVPLIGRFTGPKLSRFDDGVRAYGAANNNFDRVTLLGTMLRDSNELMQLPPAQMTEPHAQALGTLRITIKDDLNQICGEASKYNRNQDIIAAGNGGALAPRTVVVNVYYLHQLGVAPPPVGPVDATINAHLATARDIFNGAQITFVRSNAAATPISQAPNPGGAFEGILSPPAAPGLPAGGVFGVGGTGGPRLITALNATVPAPKSIDVIYIPRFDENDVQGYTFAAQHSYDGVFPRRPMVVMTLHPPADGDATYPSTLAHELGHALTGELNHSTDANDLMCGGANRTGSDISPGEIGWFRYNGWI